MSKQLTLGVLDFCSVPNKTSVYNLRSTIQLARQAEILGYSRYWLAEHHEFTSHASPEILIPTIAGMTKKIRVGSAGILLYFYSPLKVAENFKLLETLFRGRIDLGLCRGATIPSIAKELLDGRTRILNLDLYREKVENLLHFLHDSSSIYVPPAGSVTPPEVWSLGSGWNSMRLAAQNGIAYSHSLFHKGAQDDPNIVQEYRKTFQPRLLLSPKLNIAVAGICADTEDRAYELLKQHKNSFVIPTVVGTAGQCKEKLLAIQKRFDVDEIIFLDLCHELEDRLRSYELLASELNLRDYPHDSNKSNECNSNEENLKLVSSGSTHN